MLTDRDDKVLSMVERLKVARSSTLEQFFPSKSACQKRLLALTKSGVLHRERDPKGNEYVYYIAKPKQTRHALLVSDFYSVLAKQAEVIVYDVERPFGNIRPDAVAGFIADGMERVAFVEVELSHKGFDAGKYKAFNWRQYFDEQPELFVVSDGKIPQTGYGMKRIKTDLKFEV